MAEITPQMVKELRERTGIGMTKCKKALEESNGDMELAIVNLRKAGEASAVKKEGRSTKEGIIACAENDKTLAMVEVNAETDFVVNNDRFRSFVQDVVREAVSSRPTSLQEFLQQKFSKDHALTIDLYRASLVQAIGENIQIKRVKIFDKEKDKSIGVYSHLGGKIVAIVELAGTGDEQDFAKDIAMHVAAAAPEYLSPDVVPQNIIAKEKEIARSQVEGKKPANIIDKIVEGKMKNFYSTACLLEQRYIKNEEINIGELLSSRIKETGKTMAIQGFERWSVMPQ